MLLLAPFASLPLAVRRRWPVPVFFVVLVASVAFSIFGPKVSPLTGPIYGLYTVAVQADRKWSLLALAAIEVGTFVNGAEHEIVCRSPGNCTTSWRTRWASSRCRLGWAAT
jgi:hypothetical protein